MRNRREDAKKGLGGGTYKKKKKRFPLKVGCKEGCRNGQLADKSCGDREGMSHVKDSPVKKKTIVGKLQGVERGEKKRGGKTHGIRKRGDPA